MNDSEALARGYRRVLACYPKAFRRENEQEILTVLLDTAAEGQRRVGLAESAALIRGALRMRLRPPARPPRTVRGAVRLMCLGAVAELASVVTTVVTMASVKAAIAQTPGLTAAQWHTTTGLLAFRAVSSGLAVAVWLLLAWALSRGRDAARFAFSALFALVSLTMIIALAQHGWSDAPADIVAGAAVWVIALATMILLFSRPANTYYRQAGRPPVAHAAR